MSLGFVQSIVFILETCSKQLIKSLLDFASFDEITNLRMKYRE